MTTFISLTPIDEMDGDKHVVHAAMLVNPMALRKIESIEVEAPKPAVPKVEGGDKEPVAAPSASSVPAIVAPMVITMITFLDGKTMHVKEPVSNLSGIVF